MQSVHQCLVFFGTVISCTISPHHISNSSSFCYPEMFYMLICFFVSRLYLSDDRQDIYRTDIFYFNGFIVLRVTCANDNSHSRHKEIFQGCLQSKVIHSGHTLLYLLEPILLALNALLRFRSLTPCGAMSFNSVPIIGRQPC